MTSIRNYLRTNRKFLTFIFISFFSTIIAGILSYQNSNGLLGTFFWLNSIIFYLLSFFKNKGQKNKTSIKIVVLFSILICLPLIARILNYSPLRLHGDDAITAFFSSKYNLLKNNFFDPIPTDKGEWVCQFPSLFFINQKLFFILFGESLLTIKLSVLPYVFIVSLMLFLIIKDIFDLKTAVIGLILYSFFPASLYLETLGLHFTSSTAIFLIFFYFILENLNKPNSVKLALLGLSCGFCYLFYSSSYIALPVLLIFFFIKYFKNKKIFLRIILIPLFGFLIVLLPFVINMTKKNNYYLAGRIKQVSLINGEWSGAKDQIKNGEKILTVINKNLILSFKSFYTDGIGGAGGYSFGSLALFNKYMLILFCIGTTCSLALLLSRNKNLSNSLFFILITIIISFVAGMVLTIPPPPFHRFSVVFPFIIIIDIVPFYLFLNKIRENNTIKILVLFPIIIFLCMSNINYYRKTIAEEIENTDVKLSLFIQDKFPDAKKIFIAAFPSYALEKIAYFTNINRITFQTEYHKTFLDNFNSNEKYVYIITMPQIFNDKFKSLDKQGTIIKFSDNYSIFSN